jgi:cytidine deaminase
MTTRTPGTPKRNSASDTGDSELSQRAIAALAHAYSPYSKLRVGAALRATDGRIFTGCNVENASFGLTSCAERTALVKAVSEGAREFDALAVASDGAHAPMPCGACRQMLSEFAPNLRVLIASSGTKWRERSLSDLLPEAFGPSDVR